MTGQAYRIRATRNTPVPGCIRNTLILAAALAALALTAATTLLITGCWTP